MNFQSTPVCEEDFRLASSSGKSCPAPSTDADTDASTREIKLFFIRGRKG